MGEYVNRSTVMHLDDCTNQIENMETQLKV